MFFFSRMLRKKMKELHKSVQEKEGSVRSFLQEVLENLLVLKVFGVEKRMEAGAEELQETHFKAQMKRRNFSIAANAGLNLVYRAGYLYTSPF